MVNFIQEISLPNKPQPIVDMLGSTSKLGRLKQHIGQIKQFEEKFRQLLPTPLSKDYSWNVGNFRDQHLTLFTENSGQATKLRFQQQLLLDNARLVQADVETISIKVVYAGIEQKNVVKNITRTLSLDAAEAISASAEHIGDEELKVALQRLSKHGKKKPI